MKKFVVRKAKMSTVRMTSSMVKLFAGMRVKPILPSVPRFTERRKRG